MAYDSYDRDDRHRSRWNREPQGGRDDDRGFLDRASDEVRSWFGDEEAERRRRYDEREDEGRGDRPSYGRGGQDRWGDRDGGRGYGTRDDRSGRGYGGGSGYGSDRGSYDDRSEHRDRGGRNNYGSSDYGRGGYGSQERGRGGYGGDSSYGSSSYGDSPGYGRGGYGSGSSPSGRHGGGEGGRGGYGYDSDSRGGYGRSQGSGSGYGSGRSSGDDDYSRWRNQQIDALDRDYDEYRRENQSRFDSEFAGWRTRRQGQRQHLERIEEHMEVVGSDGTTIGKVDKVRGDRVILTKNDDPEGHHHSFSSSWIDSVADKVTLSKTAAEAKKAWKDEDRRQPLGGERGSEDGPRTLDRSFSGTY